MIRRPPRSTLFPSPTLFRPHLARVQMRALFGELLARTSWLETAGEPVYQRSSFQRGVKHLPIRWTRSEEHTSELQSQSNLVCRLLLEKKKKKMKTTYDNHRV